MLIDAYVAGQRVNLGYGIKTTRAAYAPARTGGRPGTASSPPAPGPWPLAHSTRTDQCRRIRPVCGLPHPPQHGAGFQREEVHPVLYW